MLCTAFVPGIGPLLLITRPASGVLGDLNRYGAVNFEDFLIFATPSRYGAGPRRTRRIHGPSPAQRVPR